MHVYTWEKEEIPKKGYDVYVQKGDRTWMHHRMVHTQFICDGVMRLLERDGVTARLIQRSDGKVLRVVNGKGSE